MTIKKKMNMETKEETKCCGNCYYFTHEDIDGTGFCHIFKKLHFCGDTECRDWKSREDEA